MKITVNRTLRRKRRVSSRIYGTAERPRIAVNRSNSYIYAQAIDDAKKMTIAMYSSLHLKKEAGESKMTKTEQAKQVGIKLAQLLTKKNIKEVVFDRSQYAYNGRVKLLAEGLREGSLKV